MKWVFLLSPLIVQEQVVRLDKLWTSPELRGEVAHLILQSGGVELPDGLPESLQSQVSEGLW